MPHRVLSAVRWVTKDTGRASLDAQPGPGPRERATFATRR